MKNLKNTQTRNLLISKILKNKNQNQRLLTKSKNRITLVITSDHPVQGVQFTMPLHLVSHSWGYRELHIWK